MVWFTYIFLLRHMAAQYLANLLHAVKTKQTWKQNN